MTTTMTSVPPPLVGMAGSTRNLYVTPQLEKRPDGLAPSLFDPDSFSHHSKKFPEKAVLFKTYRTSSRFLKATPKDDSRELQTIVDSITSTLEYMTDVKNGTKDFVSLTFEPQGCLWTLEFNPNLRAKAYQMHVICRACGDINEHNTYVVDSMVVAKDNSQEKLVSIFKEVNDAFDFAALQIRRAIVKLEFPDFPEGCKGRPFRDVYQLNARLKSGSFATVCRGTHRASGKKVAIKCVLRKDLPPSDDAAIYDEVAILSSLDHPHITPLIDFFDEKDCYFLVMELMAGGDLFDRIGKKKSYSEGDARDLCAKMLHAVAYCHQLNIAHCDMKPKNLLLASQDHDSYIKLADFGFAARVHAPKSLTKQCGTPFFVAPEILMRKAYDQKSDMWSVGCIIYLLLSGNLPFMGRSQKELFRNIVVGRFEFDDDSWTDISDHARDIVCNLLVTDPDKRLSSMACLQHPWLQQDSKRLSLIKLKGTSQRLKTFNARMKLRSAMIAVDWAEGLRSKSFRALGAQKRKKPKRVKDDEDTESS